MKIIINTNENIFKTLIHAILVSKIINIKVTVFFKKQNYDFFKLEFFIKIKEKSEITSPLIHGGQWTAILKPSYFLKRISNSDVTLKVTKSYTFLFKFAFETPKLF